MNALHGRVGAAQDPSFPSGGTLHGTIVTPIGGLCSVHSFLALQAGGLQLL